jgi:endonuclease/exonuclease/phosphatase (EEP) superfamily protein YafD
MLAVATAYLGALHPVLELFAQFTVYYLFAAAFTALGLLLFRCWRTFTVAALALALAAAKVLPIYIPPASPTQNGPVTPLKAITFNVEYPDGNAPDVFTYIAKSGPDIFTAQEITEEWIPKLSGLAEVYPYRIERHRPRDYGVILYSKYPLRKVALPHEANLDTHAIAAIVNISGTEVLVVAIHTYQTRPLQAAMRVEQMRVLASWLGRFVLPKMLLGDFNVTPWSSHYERFLARTDLVSSREGIGILPTYPTYTRPIMIPIDHCFVSRDILVERCAVGPHLGSDHLPLEVDLLLPREY